MFTVPSNYHHGNAASNMPGVGVGIPKEELVSVLQALLRNRLQIPREVPEVQVLLQESGNFKMKWKVAKADRSLEDWREGPDDDLVYAVGLAA